MTIYEKNGFIGKDIVLDGDYFTSAQAEDIGGVHIAKGGVYIRRNGSFVEMNSSDKGYATRMSTVMSDVLSGEFVPDSTTALWAYFKNLGAQNAMIEELFTNNITSSNYSESSDGKPTSGYKLTYEDGIVKAFGGKFSNIDIFGDSKFYGDMDNDAITTDKGSVGASHTFTSASSSTMYADTTIIANGCTPNIVHHNPNRYGVYGDDSIVNLAYVTNPNAEMYPYTSQGDGNTFEVKFTPNTTVNVGTAPSNTTCTLTLVRNYSQKIEIALPPRVKYNTASLDIYVNGVSVLSYPSEDIIPYIQTVSFSVRRGDVITARSGSYKYSDQQISGGVSKIEYASSSFAQNGITNGLWYKTVPSDVYGLALRIPLGLVSDRFINIYPPNGGRCYRNLITWEDNVRENNVKVLDGSFGPFTSCSVSINETSLSNIVAINWSTQGINFISSGGTVTSVLKGVGYSSFSFSFSTSQIPAKVYMANIYPKVAGSTDLGNTSSRFGTIYCYAVNDLNGGSGSKRELKENIVPFEQSALDIINSTDIVSFNYRQDQTKAFKVGFIADDTNPILTGENRDMMVYNNCIGVLMKAVQELSSQNEELARRIEELENERNN